MPICACCGRTTTYDPGEICKICYPIYLKHRSSGMSVPPPMAEAGMILTFEVWAKIQNMKASMVARGKTEEEVKEALLKWAEEQAEPYLRNQRQAREQEERERQRAKIINEPTKWD